jgi:exocyst complex protein 7
VSQDVEPIVRAGPGPSANGGSGLDAFLQAMNRLQLAQEYFEKNNPQSVELENVVSLECLVYSLCRCQGLLKSLCKLTRKF